MRALFQWFGAEANARAISTLALLIGCIGSAIAFCVVNLNPTTNSSLGNEFARGRHLGQLEVRNTLAEESAKSERRSAELLANRPSVEQLIKDLENGREF
ncbi:hypothetical protein LRC39_15220 [Rhodopseudomonas sp. P1]|uniref:hypothetical protein n=1 Tax=Rhodopseudomonas sp. P1 TaxID=3434357 RepID=UPI0031FE1CEC